MFGSNRRRRHRRRLVLAALVGAAVLVPQAVAVPVLDAGRPEAPMRYGTPVEYLAPAAAPTADALDRFLANDRAHEPRGGAGSTAAVSGDDGLGIDGSSLGIGIGTGFLLAALTVGAALMVGAGRATRRGGIARA